MVERERNETGGVSVFVPIGEGRNPLTEGGIYYQWPDAYVEDPPSSEEARVIRNGIIVIPNSDRFSPDLRGKTFHLRPDKRGYDSIDGHISVLYEEKKGCWEVITD